MGGGGGGGDRGVRRGEKVLGMGLSRTGKRLLTLFTSVTSTWYPTTSAEKREATVWRVTPDVGQGGCRSARTTASTTAWGTLLSCIAATTASGECASAGKVGCLQARKHADAGPADNGAPLQSSTLAAGRKVSRKKAGAAHGPNNNTLTHDGRPSATSELRVAEAAKPPELHTKPSCDRPRPHTGLTLARRGAPPPS